MPVLHETPTTAAATTTTTTRPSYVRDGFDPLALADSLDAWAESEDRAGLPTSAATARRFAAEYRAAGLA